MALPSQFSGRRATWRFFGCCGLIGNVNQLVSFPENALKIRHISHRSVEIPDFSDPLPPVLFFSCRVWVRPGPQPQSRDCGWATLGMQPVGHRPAGAAPVARASIEFPAAAGSEALIAGRRPGSMVVDVFDKCLNDFENSELN